MAARKEKFDYQAIPQPQRIPRKREQEQIKPQISKRTRKNRERAMVFDFKYTLFLLCVVGITLGMCISYLGAQAKLSAQSKNIVKLETMLNNLLDENNAAVERLNSSLDLQEVFRIATEELGMVYPTDNQIITYDSANPDYVRQYEEIPEEE